MEVNSINTASNALIAIATIVMAILAWRSYRLSQEIHKATEEQYRREQEFKTQVTDLYKAIVISNMIGTPHGAASKEPWDEFNKHYDGTTKISLKHGK